MMKIYSIRPGLIQTARTHTLTDDECSNLVQQYGITAVLNLWHTVDHRMFSIIRSRNGWYHVNPLPDGRIDTNMADTVEYLAGRVVTEIQHGGCVLVHCWGGRNRSGLISALALMRLEGITGKDAIAAVKAVRSGALVNEHFNAYLENRP